MYDWYEDRDNFRGHMKSLGLIARTDFPFVLMLVYSISDRSEIIRHKLSVYQPAHTSHSIEALNNKALETLATMNDHGLNARALISVSPNSIEKSTRINFHAASNYPEDDSNKVFHATAFSLQELEKVFGVFVAEQNSVRSMLPEAVLVQAR